MNARSIAHKQMIEDGAPPELLRHPPMAQVPQVAAPAPVPVAPPEVTPMIDAIVRMARDTSVPLDRLEHIIKLQNQLEDRQAQTAFNIAMSAAQQEMQPIRAESDNPQTKSKYASYAALDRAIRPIYARHGFALSFNTGDGAAENCVRVLCDVSNGAWTKQYRLDMPADGKGAKGGDVMTKTHATISAVTYGKRGILGMVFNLAISQKDDDDDNAAGAQPITPDQAEQITKLVQESRCNIDVFLRLAGVESISDIRADKFSRAVAWLNQKKQAVRR